MRRVLTTVLLLVCAIFATAGSAEAARQPVGTMLGTAVVVDYEVDGVSGGLTTLSNIPYITILPIRTQSALTLLRPGQDPSAGIRIGIPTVDYALIPQNPSSGDFVSLDRQLTGLSEDIDRIDLIESRAFLPGEVIFFHLYDAGINHLTDVAETVVVRFTGVNGDVELFQLTEDGPDSGNFYGFAPTVDETDARSGDGFIAIESNTTVEAVYSDAFDDTDTRVAAALFDPGVRIIDALSGALLDGAVLRVIDEQSGGEAAIYGIDGSSTLTQALVSGQAVTDSSGRLYEAATGEATVPHLRAGRYRFDVDPPPGYVFPSDTDFARIASIDGRFRLGPGSRGEAFDLWVGGPPFMDIPVDPRGTLFLTKKADRPEVAHGDFVVFSLRLTNDDDRIATEIVLHDMLPQGFRLEPGSVRRAGEEGGDPTIDMGGERLTFRVDSLGPGESIDVRYVARVGPDARPGTQETIAIAQAPLGFRSNTARAVITVRDAFLKEESFVLGRVFIGTCDGEAGKGVRARLLTETGIAIVSDQDGLFHLDALKPGRHVLRLDESSLPDGLELLACPADLRPGDSARARTLDLRGGLVRNIRFRLRDTRPAPVMAPVTEPKVQSEDVGERIVDGRSSNRPAKPTKIAPRPRRIEFGPDDLATLEPVLQILYPVADGPPTRPLFDLGVAYPFGHRIEVTINGAPVDPERFEKVVANKESRIALRHWRGIDVGDGPFEVGVTMRDMAGAEIASTSRAFGAKDEEGTSEFVEPRPVSSAQPPAPPKAVTAADAAPRIESADGLAALAKELQIVYPSEGEAIRDGVFDLGVAYPMGGQIEVSVDGIPLDPSLFDKTLANRKARMVLRRWKGVDAGNDGTLIEATLIGRDGAVTARVARRVGGGGGTDSTPLGGEVDAPVAVQLTKTERTPEEPEARPAVPKVSGPHPVRITSSPAVLALERRARAGITKRANDESAMLADLPKALTIVYPEENAILADPSLRLGVAHPFGNTVTAYVNGVEIRGLSAEKSLSNRKAGMALRRWRGVDLPDGETVIEIVMHDRDGVEVARETRLVHYVTDAIDAEYVAEKSVLIADGATAPVIAVRLTDAAGRALHAGRRVPVIVAPPYQSAQSFERFEDNPLVAAAASRAALVVGADGLARLKLRPTTRSGEVDIRVRLGSGESRLRPWLTAGKRPWIVVGHAEGTVGHERLRWGRESQDESGFDADARMAFYARGTVYDDWILTFSYDSEQRRDEEDLFGRIDPNDYYPLYGDASTRSDTTPSRYPLYARVERERFYAMFGDFETGLDRTDLGTYTRALSGLKTEYRGERLSVNAFAAEADQQFLRREFQANQGVGPYRLDGPAIRNSETVTLITREREELETVLTEAVLTPFVDYDIDYAEGIVILRRAPVPVDDAFNPRFLSVEFERDSPDPGRITAGGRAALTFFDDQLELGATAIHEEGAGHDSSGNLVAIDATAQLGDVEIEAEIAGSRLEADGIEKDGTAMRAEARYTSESWRGRIYVHQADEDFGIANQSVGRQGRRVVGAEVYASIPDPLHDPERDEGQAPEYDLSATVIHDEALESGDRRTSAEALLSRKVDFGVYGTGTLSLGYRGEHDRPATGQKGTSHKVLGRAALSVLDGRATLGVERAQTIVKTDAGASTDSTLARIEGRIMPGVRGRAAVEVFDDAGGVNVATGVDADVWEGATVEAGIAGTGYGAGGSGGRLGATLGVQQDLKLTDRMSLTLRAHRTQALGGSTSPVAQGLFATTEPQDTTTASAGLGYAGEGWNASARADAVMQDDSDRFSLGGAVIGDVTESLTLAAASNVTLTRKEADDRVDGEMTLAAAYRPLSARYSGLERLELRFSDDASDSFSAIHNLTASFDVTERFSVAFAHGLRFTKTSIGGEDFSSLTNFIGGDVFYDFDERWFIGAHGRALTAIGEGETAYSYGASIGFAPRPGIILSLGYNLEGFDDSDFDDAHHTRQGPFLRLSLRFDEDDIRALIPETSFFASE